jgi:predicted small integral membrane protein
MIEIILNSHAPVQMRPYRIFENKVKIDNYFPVDIFHELWFKSVTFIHNRRIRMNNRLIKICLGIAVGFYMLLVCYNNLSDYDTNFQFVSKVSGMDDVFSREKNGWRAITSLVLQHIFYLFIIGWEILITILVALGVVRMLRAYRAETPAFKNSGKMLRTGLFLGISLWFTTFVTIGGEWFLMWQSKTWNGQNTAFMLTICFLLFLTYQHQVDDGQD